MEPGRWNESMAAGPAGGGTEQAFELARNFKSYSRVSVSYVAPEDKLVLAGASVFFSSTPLVSSLAILGRDFVRPHPARYRSPRLPESRSS
jgi:hypothetical protein